MQTYLIQTDPDSSDIHQSLNNSALQLGIALGSGIGGVVLEQTNSVINTAPIGSGVVIGALLFVAFSLKLPAHTSQSEVQK
jgi:DHA1 family purine base/nucleoside efflux pump-like MFS transporter